MGTLPSERVAVLATIDPDAYTANTYNSDVIDMSLWGSIMVIVQAGALGSSATLDVAVKSDTASGGSYSTTVDSITQLTDAGSDSDKQVVMNILQEDLTEGHRYVRVDMTIATATSDAALIVLGLDPVYAPANSNDLASVDEITTV